MANTDNAWRAAEPTQPPKSDESRVRPPATLDEEAHPVERDESTTPPHGDPLLEATEHEGQRDSDGQATRSRS